MGIFCAAAPAVKPLIRKLAPGFLSSVGSRFTSERSGRSKGNMGTYASETTNSRLDHHKGDGAIQLSSQTELEDFSRGNLSISTTNKFWAERSKTSSSDDSEKGVLGLESARQGGIHKTVTVHVVEQNNAEDLEIGRGKGVRRFEHV